LRARDYIVVNRKVFKEVWLSGKKED